MLQELACYNIRFRFDEHTSSILLGDVEMFSFYHIYQHKIKPLRVNEHSVLIICDVTEITMIALD